jgi:hypothetical protein
MKKLLSISISAMLFIISSCSGEAQDPLPENPADMPYEVTINPDDFVSTNIVGNDFWPLTVRTTVHEGEEPNGPATRVVVEYTSETKVVMGVTCAVVRDRVYEDDELVEDTYDWYAQDNQGNVWYFGEDSEEIENGIVVSTHGSWEAGVDGALPGIIMLANPIVGLWYRQEFFEGEAEDVAQILSLNATVTVPYQSAPFTNCVQIAEWSLLEPGIVEHKYYVAGIGVIRTVKVKGGSDFEDLVEIN